MDQCWQWLGRYGSAARVRDAWLAVYDAYQGLSTVPFVPLDLSWLSLNGIFTPSRYKSRVVPTWKPRHLLVLTDVLLRCVSAGTTPLVV